MTLAEAKAKFKDNAYRHYLMQKKLDDKKASPGPNTNLLGTHKGAYVSLAAQIDAATSEAAIKALVGGLTLTP